MSPKLNWASKDGKFQSAVPMTALTFGHLLMSYAPQGQETKIRVVNERRIEITGEWATVVIEGSDPQ